MKRRTVAFLIMGVFFGCLTGCGDKSNYTKIEKQETKTEESVVLDKDKNHWSYYSKQKPEMNFTMDGYDWIEKEDAKRIYLDIIENIDSDSIIARYIGEEEKVSEVLIDINCNGTTYTETIYRFYNDVSEYEAGKSYNDTLNKLVDASEEALYIICKDETILEDDLNSYEFVKVKYAIGMPDRYQVMWKN